MLQKNLLKMLIKRYSSDSAKCFLTSCSHKWCVTLIPARFYVYKINNEQQQSILEQDMKSAQI